MLEKFFRPESVAVIGASREKGKVGHDVLSNLIEHGFKGGIYPVNPKADEILGLKCFASIRDVPGNVDLAVVVVPARFAPDVVKDCAAKKVPALIVITAGFKETGREGAEIERRMVETARENGIRIVGPNCLGLIDTAANLNASFADGMPPKGNIAFLSQSGAFGTAILDWAIAQNIGFSKFISVGNKADIDEVELTQAIGEDAHSNVILGYVESIARGREFMRVAAEITRRKPVILMKSGGTAAGARAASSHTGALAGSENAYTAAFKQAGVMRASKVEDLFDWGLAFSYQGGIEGPRVALVTNAGGPGIIATDAIENSDLKMADFTRETIAVLRDKLPPTANVYNPIDVIGDVKADRYAVALEGALNDPGVDGVIVILTPQTSTEPLPTAEVIAEAARGTNKPVLACFLGGNTVDRAARHLMEHRVPTFPFPERAVGAMDALYRYRRWSRRTTAEPAVYDVDRAKVREVFEKARAANQLELGEVETRQVVTAYGFRVPASSLARTGDDAVRLANEMGLPVVMKIASPDILHKSDVGGVAVGLKTADEVAESYQKMMTNVRRHMPHADVRGVLIQEMIGGGREVILGMTRDPQFGPMLMFGLGGIYVEVLKDVAFRIAPIAMADARAMMSEIRSRALLRGVRGQQPADVDAVAEGLLRLSQLVTDFPEIVEMDVNPLSVFPRGQGAVAIDARLTLAPLDEQGS